MKRKEIGEYLYLYYHKRSSSFLLNIYKAGLTNDAQDIHRARLDAKRIFAIFDLLEIVNPFDFRQKKARRIYEPVYKQAGLIREVQISRLIIDQQTMDIKLIPGFMNWLKKKERSSVKKFVHLIEKIDQEDLEKIDSVINKICDNSSIFNIRSKTMEFYKRKSSMITNILLTKPDETGLHNIRKVLKSISTIATLALSLKPEPDQDKSVSALNRVEMVLGDWHDLTILRSYTDQFLTEYQDDISDTEKQQLDDLKIQLKIKSENLQENVLPEVEKIVQMF